MLTRLRPSELVDSIHAGGALAEIAHRLVWLVGGVEKADQLLSILVFLEVYLSYVRVKHRRYGVPHLRFGRWAMALFFSLLPVLIVFGDMPWFVHGVLIIGIASKLQLAWMFWNRQTN